MPKHSRKRRRSRSPSQSKDDRWLRKRLAEMQKKIDKIEKVSSSAVARVSQDRDRDLHAHRERSGSAMSWSGSELASVAAGNSPTRHYEQGDNEPLPEVDTNSEVLLDQAEHLIEETTLPATVENAVVPPEPALNADILRILGSEPEPASSFAAPVHAAIATRWSEIMVKGLTDETKQELLRKYPVPGNMPILKVPVLNPEVAAAISTQVARRDERLVQKQEQLSAAISGIGEIISLLLAKEEDGDRRYIELLSDAGRLLCGFHHTETTIRKELISINLNKDIKDTLAEAPTDQYLFGVTLEERIKAAKTLEKSSQDLRPVKPKAIKKTIVPGNLRSPALPRKGARVGQQNEKAPYRPYRPTNPHRSAYRDPQLGRWKKTEERRRDASKTKADNLKRRH